MKQLTIELIFSEAFELTGMIILISAKVSMGCVVTNQYKMNILQARNSKHVIKVRNNGTEIPHPKSNSTAHLHIGDYICKYKCVNLLQLSRAPHITIISENNI